MKDLQGPLKIFSYNLPHFVGEAMSLSGISKCGVLANDKGLI